jgi:two-component system, OmpR family, sensor histidine kinase KdpD
LSQSKVPFFRTIVESGLSVGITLGAATVAHNWLSLANLAFLFLVPVIVMAGKRGLMSGLFTAILATLGFNFFFVPPAFTLHVTDVDNLVTLLVLSLTAAMVSQVAARLKSQAMQAEALAEASVRLSSLTQDLAACATEQEVLAIADERIRAWTGFKLRFVDPDEDDTLSPLDAAAGRWALAHSIDAGRGTDVMGFADALYLAVDGSPATKVAQLSRASGSQPMAPQDRDLVKEALARTGIALHRVTVEARQQRDGMREAVLTSIGHDLRTPLTGIMAGLAALPEDEAGVVSSTRAEANRLERLVSNILDLARLRSDAMPKAREAIDLTDAIDAALSTLSTRLAEHTVSVSLPQDLPLVRSDARMLHHMLLNLIENAAKFSVAHSSILIVGSQTEEGVKITLTDEGRGLPNPGAHYPKRETTEQISGSGLGLTVVSGFASVLGIEFQADNRRDGKRGAQMTLTFPPLLCISAASELA